ncbi:MAG: hypothetical protein QOE35_1802 [Actinomycetota bacterium]|jgi:hypothetical protein
MAKVLLSCVGENAPMWHNKMENLVLSMRLFGGSLSGCPVVVNVVESVDPEFRERMARWDAEVRVVARVDTRLPVANKLHVLDLATTDAFDIVLMLDCDVIVMGDVAPELGSGTLRGLPAGRSHISAAAWSRLYAALGIAEPAPDWVLSVSGERSHPYVNSGVLFVPHALCAPLREGWYGHMQWLLGPEGVELLGRPVHRDQIPLALTLATLAVQVDPLPRNLNLSTTAAQPVPAQFRSQDGPPFILHYHRSIDSDGFLTRSPRRAVNPWLDEFNAARADALGIPYHGLGSLPARSQVAAFLKSRGWDRRIPRRPRRQGRPAGSSS